MPVAARDAAGAAAAASPELRAAGTVRPELSVVIVSWNAGTALLACLRSLHANPPTCDWEAIVVDNGSSDGSVARILRELPSVRVIANPRNRGLAAANNQGIAASTGRCVLISNPDVIYPPGAVDALRDVLARRQRAAFAVANLRYPDGGLQASVGSLPSRREALLGRRLGRHFAHGGGMWWYEWPHDEERAVGHGAEACYLVRRQAIAEIGLQDERFTLDWEGLDWSARALARGWEVWFCPTANVTHLEGASRGQVPGRLIVGAHRGMYLYLRARSHPLARPLLAAVVSLRAVTRLTLTFARRARR